MDIGATKINYGLVSLTGRIFNNQRVKTKPAFLKQLKEIISQNLSPKVSAIGISFAGPVNSRKGVVLKAFNFSGSPKNISLKKLVSSWSKKLVFVENDAACFSLAEAIFGPGKNCDPVIGITLGTGVGGSIIINKKIYHGHSHGAELGHMKITEKGFRCSCKKIGHFESHVSGPAMIKYYKKFTDQTRGTYQIVELAAKGNKRAKRVINTMGYFLGLGLANIANALDPEIMVIGGGLSEIKSLFPPAIKTMKKELISRELNKVKIVKSKLGNNAMLLGAALITQSKYRSKI